MNHPDYSKHAKTGTDGLCMSLHAEEVAIDNLPIRKSKKMKKVSILVIRISRSSNENEYVLSDSKPCVYCLSKILKATEKGYKINKIYYSVGATQSIACTNVKNIIPSVSKFYRKQGLNKDLKNIMQMCEC